MKARSRREIINENKELRKECESLKKDVNWHKADASQARDYANRTRRDLMNAHERLRMAGLDGGYEYTKGADSGTIRDYVTTFEPYRISMTGEFPIADREYIAMTLAERIAKKLIESGLILLEYSPDPRTGETVVESRLDVVPWQMITSKNTMVSVLDTGRMRPWRDE